MRLEDWKKTGKQTGALKRKLGIKKGENLEPGAMITKMHKIQNGPQLSLKKRIARDGLV